MLNYYNGDNSTGIPGILPEPYYWWEGGALMDTLLQYWQLTGDAQYNDLVSQALVFQQGANKDFMPANQTKGEGNDDQATWALAAISAAELNLPEPEGTSWIYLAETVFNEQVARWDTNTCNGGLRWQIFTFNNGYNYKNSISSGDFFQLASRLARYTGNTTYSDWASKIYDWSTDIGFISSNFDVYDGADVTTNCTSVNRVQFSSFVGTYIAGAAYLYNSTSGSAQWKSVLDSLLKQTLATFSPNEIATEIACEAHDTCNVDMYTYKGILAQQLVDTVQMAPYTSSLILPKLTSTAKAAANACNGRTCGSLWDRASEKVKRNLIGSTGLGQQMSALSYVQALVVGQAKGVVTESTGGINGSATTTGAANSSTRAQPAATTAASAGVAFIGNRMSAVATVVFVGLDFLVDHIECNGVRFSCTNNQKSS